MLDSLVATGVELTHHYVFKYCSPTRASFLTGRLPYHVHQWNLDENSPWGTNINMTFIAAKLKHAGYSTHMIGKWGVGFFAPQYLPTSRDHFNQRSDGAACAVDFWKNSAPDHRNGTYDAWVYRDDVEALFSPPMQPLPPPGSAPAPPPPPLFLFMAFHNVHSPMQAPSWLIDQQNQSLCETRRTLHAMVAAVDNVTTVIIDKLKEHNIIIAFSADNGGAPGVGSNYPLRGCKSTFFEGGVRSVAFLHSPLLPPQSRGTKLDGLMHIADWYATFSILAGVNPSDSGVGKYPIDAIDMWPYLSGTVSESPRKDVVIGFNFTHSHPLQGAIIVGNHKLIVGLQGYNSNDSLSWTPPDFPCAKVADGADCNPYCVFDIYADESERTDLSATNATLLSALIERYQNLGKEEVNWHDRAGSKPGGRTPDDPSKT
eukprot:gene17179-33551_t